MEIPLLSNIVIIFGLSIAVLLLCYRLHIPAIVGYLLTRVMAGPHGLGLIGEASEVEILAEYPSAARPLCLSCFRRALL